MPKNSKLIRSTILIIIVLLIILDLIMIHVNFKLKSQLKNLDSILKQQSHSLYIAKIELELIGNSFPIEKLLYNQSISNIPKTYLIGLFSMIGCSACLRDESIEWEELHRNFTNNSFNVIAICIDSVTANAYRYESEFLPSFPVIADEKGYISKLLSLSQYPATLLVSKNGLIIYAHIAEANNFRKSEAFYNKIKAYLKNELQF